MVIWLRSADRASGRLWRLTCANLRLHQIHIVPLNSDFPFQKTLRSAETRQHSWQTWFVLSLRPPLDLEAAAKFQKTNAGHEDQQKTVAKTRTTQRGHPAQTQTKLPETETSNTAENEQTSEKQGKNKFKKRTHAYATQKNCAPWSAERKGQKRTKTGHGTGRDGHKRALHQGRRPRRRKEDEGRRAATMERKVIHQGAGTKGATSAD